MVNTHKERYLFLEFLKNPVSWLETEILYNSYTTRREAQEDTDHMAINVKPLGDAGSAARREGSARREALSFPTRRKRSLRKVPSQPSALTGMVILTRRQGNPIKIK